MYGGQFKKAFESSYSKFSSYKEYILDGWFLFAKHHLAYTLKESCAATSVRNSMSFDLL